MSLRAPERLLRERGSVMPLMIGFCLILLMLILVVVGASKVFLVQRQLASAADAATLAGADGFDTAQIYNGTDAKDVGLSQGLACDLAAQSFAENTDQLPAGSTSMTSCSTDGGRTITIHVTSTATLPILNSFFPAALTVTAESSAQGRS